MFTKEQEQQYLRDGICPECGEDNIEIAPFETDTDIAWRIAKCLSCSTEWYENFALVGIQEINQDTLNTVPGDVAARDSL